MSGKNRRRLFIVDEPFQMKYSLLLGLSGLAVSLIAGIIFYSHVNSLDRSLVMLGLGDNPDALVFLAYQKKLLLVKISAVSVIITAFMFLIGVVLSNKISGAVFSIRRSLKEIANRGDFSTRFRVRDHDELKDLVLDLNKTMERLDMEHSRASKHNR
jgi:methyl-accepting chemotaxis protein